MMAPNSRLYLAIGGGLIACSDLQELLVAAKCRYSWEFSKELANVDKYRKEINGTRMQALCERKYWTLN